MKLLTLFMYKSPNTTYISNQFSTMLINFISEPGICYLLFMWKLLEWKLNICLETLHKYRTTSLQTSLPAINSKSCWQGLSKCSNEGIPFLFRYKLLFLFVNKKLVTHAEEIGENH